MQLRVPLHRISLVRERTIDYPVGEQIHYSAHIAHIAATMLHDADREHFLVAALNNASRIIGITDAFVGGLTGCVVHVREVLTYILLARAKAFIVAHNHPSGDTTPSQADIQLTACLYEAGKLLDVTLLDHVIIGWSGPEIWEYYSLADHGLLEPEEHTHV